MKHSSLADMDQHARRLHVLRRQTARLDRCLLELEARSSRISTWRLFSFALLLVGGGAVLLTWGIWPWLAASLVFLAIFVYWVIKFRTVDSSAARLRIWRELKQDQVARMTLDWERIPQTEPLDAHFEHPFGRDIDIVGERSLQRVIDLSITVEGSSLLREWLLEFEPDLDAMPRRQRLVRELIRLPSWSARFSLNALLAAGRQAKKSYGRWSSAELVKWLGVKTNASSLRPALILLLVLMPINLGLLWAYYAALLPPLFLLSWFIYGAITIVQMRSVDPVFQDAASISDSLRQLEALFSSLQGRSLKNFPALGEFLQPLREAGRSPTELLARTNRLLAAAGLRYNPIVAVLVNALFPLDVLVAYRLDALKQELSQVLPEWLSIWHELEALGSLANFGYLYPNANFAQIRLQDDPDALPFSGGGIGHPLITAEERVCNDFTIDEAGTLVMITGSNMAGKSTFLRTLGVNARLALSGAPVLADSLTLTPLRVFASITVADSITDGFSFFYAEVRRLKWLLDCLHEADAVTVFFLIDEIFRGTNNRERLIGSQSYVSALLGGNGCGAIATHDLELVKLAQQNPAVSNFHFRDDVVNGRMVFDYKIHPGPCPTTNALRIMRLTGLPVDSLEDLPD